MLPIANETSAIFITYIAFIRLFYEMSIIMMCTEIYL